MKKLYLILFISLVMTFLASCTNILTNSELLKESTIIADEPSTKINQKLKDEAQNEVVINNSDESNVTTDINQYKERKLIASSSTTFNPNQVNRSSNIRLSAKYIIKPNEEFSFNKVVGKRTAEKGFLSADVFSGNSVVKGIGGGICQTSTTICMAVKQTDMKIVEQNPHSQRVTYASIEDEAMINYGTSDFRFVNMYDFSVMIEISFEKVTDREIIKCDIFELQ